MGYPSFLGSENKIIRVSSNKYTNYIINFKINHIATYETVITICSVRKNPFMIAHMFSQGMTGNKFFSTK